MHPGSPRGCGPILRGGEAGQRGRESERLNEANVGTESRERESGHASSKGKRRQTRRVREQDCRRITEGVGTDLNRNRGQCCRRNVGETFVRSERTRGAGQRGDVDEEIRVWKESTDR